MRDRDNFRGKSPAERKDCSGAGTLDTKYDKFLDKVVKRFPEMKILKASRQDGSKR